MSSASAPDRPAAPVFVGGAPRSGTHVVAHLLGAHPRYHVIPYEITLHTHLRRGIPASVRGKIERDDLVAELRGYWWRRQAVPDRTELERGLYKLVERAQFDQLGARFASGPDDDRLSAARSLAGDLFALITRGSGRPGFVEHSPENLNTAPDVLALFPDAKFIHVVRDGRDRACSVVPLPFGAETHAEALRRWALVLRRGEQVAQTLPAEKLLVIQLEDLVVADRARSYERLREFLALPDDHAMRSFFESEVDPERAHIGRWRTEPAESERAELDSAYRATIAELRADAISCAPRDRSLDLADGVVPSRLSRVDPWAGGDADDI